MIKILATLLVLVPSTAFAACFGGNTFKTCYDSNGNNYTVNRMGNSTYMQGYNAQTGSSWTQNSQTLGNTTYHNGTTNGRSWNMQQQQFGNGQTFSGTNSYGQHFNKTCWNGNCY